MVSMTPIEPRSTDEPPLTDAQAALLARHEPDIRRAAAFACRKNRMIDPDDAVSDATMGAIRAIRAYDDSMGATLATYIAIRARYAIADGLRDRNATRRVEGRQRVVNARTNTLHPRADDTDEPHPEMVVPVIAPHDASPDELDEARHIICAIAKTRRDQLILALIYVEGLTMKEAGVVVGLCESRISQIHSGLIARARSMAALGRIGRG